MNSNHANPPKDLFLSQCQLGHLDLLKKLILIKIIFTVHIGYLIYLKFWTKVGKIVQFPLDCTFFQIPPLFSPMAQSFSSIKKINYWDQI